MTRYYDSLAEKYSSESTHLKRNYDTYSFFRLALAVAMIFTVYSFVVSLQWIYGLISVLLLVLFVLCVKKHRSILWQKRIVENLRDINREEAGFLVSGKGSFYDGARYTDSTHFYTYDLDIFGKDSLFQHLNRTSTCVGERKLAESLQRPFSPRRGAAPAGCHQRTERKPRLETKPFRPRKNDA
ncbi:MAG: hypothetical protein LRY55_14075 [Leadbetterella sp.]|nr:hypothetical protein [Leadbetterella sp.]